MPGPPGRALGVREYVRPGSPHTLRHKPGGNPHRHQPLTPAPATAAPLVYSGWRKGAPLDTAAARMRYWKLDREKTTVFS